MKRLLLLSMITFFLMISCDTDTGIKPLKSYIEGTITFSNEWAQEPLEVRLVTSTQFPPSDINELEIGESIPYNDSAYEYTYYLEQGVYRLVGVAWRTQNSSWDFSSICGYYYSADDSLMPGEVNLNSETASAENIDIHVDRSRARVPASSEIKGEITFNGTWPDSISKAVIVATEKDPFSESLSLIDFTLGNIIPVNTASFNYSIPVSEGEYKAIGILFFKGNRPLSEEDLYYSQNLGALSVTPITVTENQTVQGPNFDIQIGEVSSGIKGTITFEGDWPADVEELRMVTTTKFPPDISDMIIGESIPTDARSYDYFFQLQPDTFKLVGVVWRPENTNWDLLSVCGVYFEGSESLAPGEIVVENNQHIVENIDIQVNRSQARKITETYINGSINFLNEWPEDITEARVIATTVFDLNQMLLPSLLDLSFSDVIPSNTNSIDYSIKAFPGDYLAVAIIFFKQGQSLSLNDIIYSSQVNGLVMDTLFTVEENKVNQGPDFEIEF